MNGSAFLLKMDNGDPLPSYLTVMGLRTTALGISTGMVATITDPKWRELLAGTTFVSVSGAGVFTGTSAETRLKANALGGVLDDYELSFESGERIRGHFLVTRLDYAGDFNSQRSYTLTLESSGPVVIV